MLKTAPGIAGNQSSVSGNEALNLNGRDAFCTNWFGLHGGLEYYTENRILTAIEAGVNFGGFEKELGKIEYNKKLFKRDDGTTAATLSSNFGARLDFLVGKPISDKIVPFFIVGGRYNRLNLDDNTDYKLTSINSTKNSLGYAAGIGVKFVTKHVNILVNTCSDGTIPSNKTTKAKLKLAKMKYQKI